MYLIFDERQGHNFVTVILNNPFFSLTTVYAIYDVIRGSSGCEKSALNITIVATLQDINSI